MEVGSSTDSARGVRTACDATTCTFQLIAPCLGFSDRSDGAVSRGIPTKVHSTVAGGVIRIDGLVQGPDLMTIKIAASSAAQALLNLNFGAQTLPNHTQTAVASAYVLPDSHPT